VRGERLEVEILLVAPCYKEQEVSAGLMGRLARVQDFTLPLLST